MYKKVLKYLAAHPVYNSSVHVVIGVGLGILVTYPFVGDHPLRWGLGLIALGLVGHLYPLWAKR